MNCHKRVLLSRYEQSVRLLLEKGANVSTQNVYGEYKFYENEDYGNTTRDMLTYNTHQ